jgi:3'-5' exoribonuclease
MKTQFVTDLQEGDTINDYFVAIRKDLRDTQTGNKFLGMVFRDRTGEIGGVLWQNASSVARMFDVGDVVNVRGAVASYQSRLQIRVEQVLPLKEGEFAMEALVEIPDDLDEYTTKVTALLATIQNPWLTKLVASFTTDESFMRVFRRSAAGKKWHHSMPGGLVRHVYELMRVSDTMSELFPNIDRDMLLTGAFLHDIGKTIEMTSDLFVEYTTPGKLLGHLTIGTVMVEKHISAIEGFPETLRLQILHCILAHHGELVNGSPITPRTLEAVVLSLADNLDAQADAFSRIVRETRENHQSWSEYINQIDRAIWTKDDI